MTVSGESARAQPHEILPPYINRSATETHWRLALGLSFALFVYGFAFALFAPFLLLMFAIPPAALLLLVIWALPQSHREPPTATVVALFWGFFVSLVLWPNYLALSLTGLPWITIIRITGIPLMFLLLICVSISKEFRARTSAVLNAVPLIWMLVTSFAVLQLLSIALSHAMSAYVFLRPGRAEHWAAVLWVMALLLCGIGLVEKHMGHVPWADHIPSFLKIQDDTVLKILKGGARSATGIYRVQSTLSTSLGFSEYLALTMPFILQFIGGSYSAWVRLAAAASVPLVVYLVVLTDSRLGAVGCGLALLIYPLLWALQRQRKGKGRVLGPLVTYLYPLFFVGSIAISLFSARIRARILGNGPQDFSNLSRIEQWKMGIPKIIANPIGHGIGVGADALGYRTPAGVLTIDSYYLVLLLEYGVIGFAIWCSLIGLSIFYAGKYGMNYKGESRDLAFLVPTSLALFNFFVIKSVFAQQDNHPLVFIMMGMVVALIYRMRQGAQAAAPVASQSKTAGAKRLWRAGTRITA